MGPFDRIMLALGGAAQSVAIATVAGGAPTWLIILCQAIGGAALALSPSVRAVAKTSVVTSP